jgi:hypothetical protein
MRPRERSGCGQKNKRDQFHFHNSSSVSSALSRERLTLPVNARRVPKLNDWKIKSNVVEVLATLHRSGGFRPAGPSRSKEL